MTKKCNLCGQDKPLGAFHAISKTNRKPRSAQCAECVNSRLRERRKEPSARERKVAMEREYNHSERGRMKIAAYNHSPAGAAAAKRFREGQRGYALLHGATEINFTSADWGRMLERFGYKCAYCGKKSDHLTHEHVLPLSRGGQHVEENIVPACQSCNSRKRNKTPQEWGVPIKWPKEKTEVA